MFAGYSTRTILFAMAIGGSTLACAALQKIDPPEMSGSYLPTFLPTLFPTVVPPSFTPPPVKPTALAACPEILAGIITAVTAFDDTPSLASRRNPQTYIVSYAVNGDQIGSPVYGAVPADLQDEQNDTATHQSVWEYFTALIPPTRRQILVEYAVITDGPRNLLAAVAQMDRDPRLWLLEVDIADTADRAELTYTLVHEFGHLLTLHPEQVPPSLAVFGHPDDHAIYLQEAGACPNYFPGEGCSQADSYINAFFNRFWPELHAEWQQINLIEDDNRYYEELNQFYRSHQDQFVTDYAVTSPEEDIAESWSFFVLSPLPAGNTIAEQKALFFYAYPELVQLRNEILNHVCVLF